MCLELYLMRLEKRDILRRFNIFIETTAQRTKTKHNVGHPGPSPNLGSITLQRVPVAVTQTKNTSKIIQYY